MDECADASLPEPQGLGGCVSHSSAEGLLEGSEMEHQRSEGIPFGLNGVGFDEKVFGRQAVSYLSTSNSYFFKESNLLISRCYPDLADSCVLPIANPVKSSR